LFHKTFPMILCVLAGCAASPPQSKYTPPNAQTIDALRGKNVELLIMPTPKFVQIDGGDQALMTVGALFGAIGGGIGAAAVIAHSESRGQALVKQDGIADPTAELTDKIRDILTQKYGSSLVDSGARYSVVVSTDSWALAKDTVVLNTSVKINDTTVLKGKKPEVVASGICRYRSPETKDGPKVDDLLANNGDKLKQTLSAALDRCVQDYRDKLFL